MLQKARAFFIERNLVEVDTSLLQRSACVDAHIDLIRCEIGDGVGYLHSSPEYAMKKLLAEGLGDCFQLGHVYRKGEVGQLHREEFTMAEWYRLGFSIDEMIAETVAFIEAIVGKRERIQRTYRELFLETIGLDPARSSDAELIAALPDGCDAGVEGRDGVLNLLLGLRVEPAIAELHGAALVVVTEYPASQSALARVAPGSDGEPVAQRFEVYSSGMELANGYHELTDPKEQAKRLAEANEQRSALGKEKLPVDHEFIAALARGLPDCCGVAVGFDRLLMLRHKTNDISTIIN